ncbi:hypothetical protein SANTM175S_07172 [Streptomyces antimycoticus]
MQGVAAQGMYGAFGVPVALLLWINFTAKLSSTPRRPDRDAEPGGRSEATDSRRGAGGAAPAPAAASDG